MTAGTRRLLEIPARNRLASRWLELEGSPEAEAMLRELDVPVADLPIVVVPGGGGLAAAVYGASEGMATILAENTALLGERSARRSAAAAAVPGNQPTRGLRRRGCPQRAGQAGASDDGHRTVGLVSAHRRLTVMPGQDRHAGVDSFALQAASGISASGRPGLLVAGVLRFPVGVLAAGGEDSPIASRDRR